MDKDVAGFASTYKAVDLVAKVVSMDFFPLAV